MWKCADLSIARSPVTLLQAANCPRERKKITMRRRRSAPAEPSSATGGESVRDPSFSMSEAILLSCFGADQLAQCSHKVLRAALIDAGLPAGAAGHLIRRSPLLKRASRGQYLLRPCPKEQVLA